MRAPATEARPGEQTVLDAVVRVLRETDACLTRGEILNQMNRLSMRPAPAHVSHDGAAVATWDTLAHQERLFEIQAAADSHPELFRNHGAGTGWTLRDDAAERRPQRSQRSQRAHGTAAPSAKGVVVGTSAEGKANVTNLCEHCGEKKIGEGKNSRQRYAIRLHLCCLCYEQTAIRDAQRKKLGLSRCHRKEEGPKLLPAPARKPRGPRPGRSGGLARRPKPGTSPPAAVRDPELRTSIGECLRTSFARHAAGELRAIADDLEATAGELDRRFITSLLERERRT